MSRFGLSCSEFYELSPREFSHAIKDHADREQANIEIALRSSWEQTRLKIYFDQIGNPNLKKRPKSPQNVFKLKWDEVKKQTPDEMKSMIAAIHIAFSKKKIKPPKPE